VELEQRVLTRTAELQESEERFRTIFDSAPIGVAVASPEARLVAANPAFAKLLGYSGKELLGMAIRDITHPDDVEKSLIGHAGLREKRAVHLRLENRYVRRDGSVVWADTAATAVRDGSGKTRYVIAMTEDITQRKREEALLAGEQRALKLITEGASLAEALTGLIESLEEHAPEMTCSILLADTEGKRLRHGAAPRLPEEYNRAVDGIEVGPSAGSCGTAAYRRERVIVEDITVDPLWTDFRELGLRHGLQACWSHPITSPAGSLLGTFAMYYRQRRGPTDAEIRLIEAAAHVASVIIERKRIDNVIQHHQSELAHFGRVCLVGALASGLAHELHQPLTAIANYSSVCARQLRKGARDQGDLQYPIERIGALALRAGEINRRFRSFVRREVPRREQAHINALAQSAVQLAAGEARRHGITVRLDLASEMPPVDVDGIQIEQVILNLVNNGLEAMSNVYREGKELVVRSSVTEDGAVELAVSDTGAGLPTALVDKAFEPFFTTKPNGLGMGLSISRSIVEAHGGRLWCDPNRNEGTTFRFTLPANPGRG
jgi:PAS domain S-box-containing protein